MPPSTPPLGVTSFSPISIQLASTSPIPQLISTTPSLDATPLNIDSLLRYCDRASTSAPCRLQTVSGRVEAIVAVVSHTPGLVSIPRSATQASVSENGGFVGASVRGVIGAGSFTIWTPIEPNVEHAVLVISVPKPSTPPVVLRAIPITRDFRYALTQVPPSPSTSFFAQSSKPHMELSLIAKGKRSLDLQIPSTETARVHSLTKELRKAVESASVSSPWSHSWLSYYAVEAEDSKTPMTSNTLTPSGSSSSSLERAFADMASPDLDEHAADDAAPNPFAPEFSRTAFLRSRLAAREKNWASHKPIKIRIATYNVNDRIPPVGTTELSPLVGDDDILVLGLQEADLRSQALLVSQGSVRADAWEKAMLTALGGKSGDYEKIAMVQYVGVLMIILVKTSLREFIGRIDTATRGIGLLGFGGNKAGVAVRLKVYDTTLCFVNSHLAAFANQLERRRLDFAALKSGLTFPVPPDVNPALDDWIPETNRPISLDDCDVLFWLGDLNYRIDLEDTDLRSLVANKEWEKIIASDQLLADIASAKSFAGFTEPDINFPPSFKYVHGSTTLDPKRSPAYTDRVLHLSRGPPVLPTSYTSHEILWSDHLPVTASFEVTVRVADRSAKLAELAGAKSELDRLEEIYRPSLGVSVDLVDFGQVKFRKTVIREIELRNDGRVSATYAFRAPAPGKPVCKQWFWPFPATGVVQSGSAQIIRITTFVDEKYAAALTAGDDMNDVLVLQVMEGKDSFISLRATFAPSIVGLELGSLPSLPSPIRNVSLVERKQLLAPQRVAFGSTPVPTPAAELAPVLFVVEGDKGVEVKPGSGASKVEQVGESGEKKTKKEDTSSVSKVVEGNNTFVEETTKTAAPSPTLSTTQTINSEIFTSVPVSPVISTSTPSSTTDTPTSMVLATAMTPKTTTTPTLTAAPMTRSMSTSSASAKPPKEMWRVLERLMEIGVGVEKLWIGEGVEIEDMLRVIEALDTGGDLVGDPKTIAATLIFLLKVLPTSIIPPSHAALCLKTKGDRDEAYAVLEGVPGSYTNVLIGLTSVVRLCLESTELDDETANVLASAVFGDDGRSEAERTERVRFVRALMEG